jgi:carbon storage regulator
MLVLSRKPGEKVRIGENIWITAIRCEEGRTRFGIEAPPEVPIHREEVLERIAAAANQSEAAL